MSQPNPHAVAADASTSALVENASRLGLKWDLRPATIVKVEPVPSHGLNAPNVLVLVDGDSTFLPATPMIQDLQIGERVYVIIVPPSGLFIAGRSAPLSIYRARQTLVSSLATVVFSDIPRNLRELEIGYSARGDAAAAISEIRMRINNTGAYTTEITQGNGAATASQLVNSSAAQAFIGHVAAASAAGGIFGVGKVWMAGWDGSGSQLLGWTFNNGVMASGGIQNVGSGIITSTLAANEIDLFPGTGSFIAGSTFYLQGTFS